MTYDLRLGRWQEALADVDAVDCLITDPPYSERVVLGYRSGSDPDLKRGCYNIPYASWAETDAVELATWAVQRVRHWAVVFNDHVGADWLRRAFDGLGWYVFAPVPWVRTDPPPRMNGDGPCSATEWITIARPRRKMPSNRMGSRPGAYVLACTSAARRGQRPIVTGQKPLGLMKSLIEDYSLPGDLVADPFSGGGTTALACILGGRHFVGSEMDPKTHALASQRLRGLGPSSEAQPNLFDAIQR